MNPQGWGLATGVATLAARLTSPLCPQLEQGLCCGRAEPLQGPAGHVLECLVLPCRTLVNELAGPVTYLLGALAGEGPLGVGQVGAGLWGFQLGLRSPPHPRSLPSPE